MRRWVVLLGLLLLTSSCGTGLIRPVEYPEPGRPDLADRRVAFARAYQWFRHGELEPALPVFTDLVGRYPELADHHLYFAGLIEVRLGHDEAAENALSRLLHDYPQSVQASSAALELGKLLVRTEHVAEGRSWLQRALAAPERNIAHAAQVALAEADERAGDVTGAYAAFMEIRHAAPGSALGRTAKEHVQALRGQHPELVPMGAALLDEARLLLAEHDYAAARDTAAQLSERADSSQSADVETSDVMRVLADALSGLGETARGLAVLRRLVDLYPDSTAAPGALFRLASVYWNRDDDAEALQAYGEFRRRYARDPRAAEALYAIGRIHERAGRTQAAIAAYGELVRRYGHHTQAPEARWRIGWMHYRAGEWSLAATAFAQVSERASSARGRNEAAYWQARALEHGGRAAAAAALYRAIIQRDEEDYYAMWAELRLGAGAPLQASGAVTTSADSVSAAGSPASALDSAPQEIDSFHVLRWQELKAAGVDALARRELAALERDAAGDVTTERYILRAYQTVDGYAAALRLLRRLGGSAGLASAERERLLHPLAFWTIVTREARANGIDPLLVVALMRQESLFDPEARSSADAIGLMQLLPVTARRVATPNDGHVDVADLVEPDFNIELGVRYLAGLLSRFHGDVLKAVAAYNGGETAVEKWERRFADLDPDEFVESISYRETRDYVKRVVTNYRTYQQLYR
ncbi:MAG TPA: transglycosylase SLT domain-containing protein [Candidatus Acidoferrales bacterium]|nr:transglycosylase SLT domain-containing protein [Candidatus Acidoferrales bacterium]